MSKQVVVGSKKYFPGISKVSHEGPNSQNPLAFKWYDEHKKVRGKTMREWFRFSVAYWHSFCNTGEDPFGSTTHNWEWLKNPDPMQRAKEKLDAAFEFCTKLGVPYYCFHDRDLAPEGRTIAESEQNLHKMVQLAKQKQLESGVKLLWGTSNLFSHARYMNGAATNPDFLVLAHAAAQVKAALEATVYLGGENYVFWGGREGYFSLLNTDMKREQEHLAMFLGKARDYGRKIGFTGMFFIEPKPMEPTKHQYDFDVATVVAFLKTYELDRDFRLNIENNHATLAGHDFAHEVQTAIDYGLFGSLDVNQGDPQNGWDTDEFLHDLYEAVKLMLVLIPYGGMRTGGMNFDAKIRRSSTDPEDLFIAHISSMDTLARALLIADLLLEDEQFSQIRQNRYASYDSGSGAAFEAGDLSFEQLHAIAIQAGEPRQISGKQELLESLINRYF